MPRTLTDGEDSSAASIVVQVLDASSPTSIPSDWTVSMPGESGVDGGSADTFIGPISTSPSSSPVPADAAHGRIASDSAKRMRHRARAVSTRSSGVSTAGRRKAVSWLPGSDLPADPSRGKAPVAFVRFRTRSQWRGPRRILTAFPVPRPASAEDARRYRGGIGNATGGRRRPPAVSEVGHRSGSRLPLLRSAHLRLAWRIVNPTISSPSILTMTSSSVISLSVAQEGFLKLT